MVQLRSGFDTNYKNYEEQGYYQSQNNYEDNYDNNNQIENDYENSYRPEEYTTFSDWKLAVNTLLHNATGWNCDDIVDFAYMDYYNSGLRPFEVFDIIKKYLDEVYDISFNELYDIAFN